MEPPRPVIEGEKRTTKQRPTMRLFERSLFGTGINIKQRNQTSLRGAISDKVEKIENPVPSYIKPPIDNKLARKNPYKAENLSQKHITSSEDHCLLTPVTKSVSISYETTFNQKLGSESSGYESCLSEISSLSPSISCSDICDSGSNGAGHVEAITNAVMQVYEEQKGLDELYIQEIKQHFSRVVKRGLQASDVKLYGSYYCGSAIANSDINFELFTQASSINNKFLYNLCKLIEKCLPNYHVSFIDSQNVKNSHIVCVEPMRGTRCVIRFLGEKNTYYRTSKLLKKVIEFDARIRPLVIAFRHWAEICAIHESESGRLHPLAFVLMVIHFLQRVNPPVVPFMTDSVEGFVVKNNQTVGELWLGLLKYYSSGFNWRDHVVSITSPELMPKSNYEWGKCWIGIESPFDSKVNIARSAVSQDVSIYIQNCLRKAYAYFSSTSEKPSTSFNSNSLSGSVKDIPRNKIYAFCSYNFTQGLDKPSMCSECIELGYPCNECNGEEAYEDSDKESLPEVSPRFIDIVSAALHEAANLNLLNDEEVRSRCSLVSNMEWYIGKRFHGVKLELMGSSVNGFGFKNSDLDICMTFINKSADDIDHKKTIRELCFHLRKNPQFGRVFAVYSAKVPLVQFHHERTNLRGDISLYNLLAVHNSSLIYHYSIIDSRTRILGCAMKLLAKNACIADTALKTLSSYSYILMVIYFLQHTDPPILPALQELYKERAPCIVEGCNASFYRFDSVEKLALWWQPKKNPMSVGELWLELLKYYTEKYNPTLVISVRQSEPLYITGIQHRARLFNIEDPFILSKNLGSVMSEKMSNTTWRTLNQAKKLFGRSCEEVPSGFQSFREYLFHPMCLTDGRVVKTVECDICGKLGHVGEKCVRFNLNAFRGIRRT